MRTGRVFPCVTRLVMSTLMSLSGITLPTAEQAAPSTEAINQSMLREVGQETMTATDGTPFVITRAIVSVPELRVAGGKPPASIELASCARDAPMRLSRAAALMCCLRVDLAIPASLLF
jgi:hypothetical protein